MENREKPLMAREMSGCSVVLLLLALFGAYVTFVVVRGTHESAEETPSASERTVHALGETKDSGPSCIETYSNLESAVYDKLSSGNTGVLETQKCATQRKVLDYLVKFPPDRRDEVLGALFDAAPRR